MFRWLFRRCGRQDEADASSHGAGENRTQESAGQACGSGRRIKCPCCHVDVSVAKDRIGVAGEAAIMAAFGIQQVRLRCPRCRTIFDVTSRGG